VQFNYPGVGLPSGAGPEAPHPLRAESQKLHGMAADIGLSQGSLVPHVRHFAQRGVGGKLVLITERLEAGIE